MTQQILIDNNSSHVLQWQDTAQFNYATPTSAQTVRSVSSAEWELDHTAQWVLTADVITAYVPPVAVDVPIHDVAAFVTTIKGSIGIVAAASITGSALMFSALETSKWDDATALIENALTLGQLTTAQHAGIKAAAITFNIPLALS